MVVHTLLFALLAPLSAFVGAQNTPPPVIVPRSGDLWTSGERQTVRWSIDGINVYSPSLQPLRGTLYLGHIINETSQYIWIHQPLASNFTYLQMQADIIVPAVPTAKNYFIVLIGQSDNWSSFFTINNPADLQGTGSVGVNITVTTVSQTASASSLSTSESVSAPVTNSSSSAVSTSASATPPSTSPSPTSSSTSSTSSSENATATGSNDVGKKMPVSVIFGAGCIILMAMFTA